MMPSTEPQGFTLKRVRQLSGLSRYAVAGLIRAGFVRPSRGPRRELRFSFQDLALLRTADALRRERVPHARIVQALRRLRAEASPAQPLTRLRLAAVGRRVIVRDAQGPRDAGSGQWVIELDAEPTGAASPGGGGEVADLRERGRARLAGADPQAWFDRAQSLERLDPVAAEQHYRRLIDAVPDFKAAYLNLGAMLSEQGRLQSAEAVYARALRMGLDDAALRYNWAIALEDLERDEAAIDAYRLALAFDDGFADAHFNLGRLLERRGDRRGALRHYGAFRRLIRQAPPD
ncbi:MAG: tetratricopeptide repeat protein [Burkholderiaceae bacterium]